jgi:hypothetical protein
MIRSSLLDPVGSPTRSVGVAILRSIAWRYDPSDENFVSTIGRAHRMAAWISESGTPAFRQSFRSLCGSARREHRYSPSFFASRSAAFWPGPSWSWPMTNPRYGSSASYHASSNLSDPPVPVTTFSRNP